MDSEVDDYKMYKEKRKKKAVYGVIVKNVIGC